jgi:hypothetical protein
MLIKISGAVDGDTNLVMTLRNCQQEAGSGHRKQIRHLVRVEEQQRWWPPAPRATTLRTAGTTPREGADGLCRGRGGEGAGPTAWLEGAAWQVWAAPTGGNTVPGGKMEGAARDGICRGGRQREKDKEEGSGSD